jgi:hypothetical protein
MTNVLEDVRNLGETQFSTEEVVVHLSELRVGEVVPRTGVTVQQRGCLDKLPAVATPLALVRIVRIAERLGRELEQLAKVVLGKVSRSVFGFVDDASRQVLLLALALEDLLLDRSGSLESVHKA